MKLWQNNAWKILITLQITCKHIKFKCHWWERCSNMVNLDMVNLDILQFKTYIRIELICKVLIPVQYFNLLSPFYSSIYLLSIKTSSRMSHAINVPFISLMSYYLCLLCAASFLAASCSSCVSHSSTGSCTYLTTDPLIKHVFTDS